MVFLTELRNHPLAAKLNSFAPARIWEKRPSLLFSLCASTLAASIMLGGGTRGGFLSDTILELIAIPTFLVSLSSLVGLPRVKNSPHVDWALMLCLAVVVLPLNQLIPLPPWIWTRLPHREEVVATFNLLGRGLPWLPISVSPASTWVSLLSLLPPVAIFISVVQLGYRDRRLLSLVLLGVGLIGTFIGLLQVAQGPASALRFFAFTNVNDAVGFFANRNHFAALLYVLLLYGGAWATDKVFALGSWKEKRDFETSSIVILTLSLLILVVLIAAEAMTRSRAGIALMIVAVCGMFALPLADRRRISGFTSVKWMLGSGVLAIAFVIQFALYRILDRFGADSLADARVPLARNTIAAVKAYLPFGSGAGTFVSVYPTFEPAQDTIANVYANHAHNDLLEVCLEGGIVTVMLLAAFLIWFGLRSAKIWGRNPADGRAIDLLLTRAATIVVPLLIAHSFFDYPLRTGAIMAVFAFSCALLVDPLVPVQSAMKSLRSLATEKDEDDLLGATSPPLLALASASTRPSEEAEGPLHTAPDKLTAWVSVVTEGDEEAAPVVTAPALPSVLDKIGDSPEDFDSKSTLAQDLTTIANNNATEDWSDVLAEASRLGFGSESDSSRTQKPNPSFSPKTSDISAPPPQGQWRGEIEWPEHSSGSGPHAPGAGGTSGKLVSAPQGLWGEDIEWPEQWGGKPAQNVITARPGLASATSENETPQVIALPASSGSILGTPGEPAAPRPGEWGKGIEWPDRWSGDTAHHEQTVGSTTEESNEESLRVAGPQGPSDQDKGKGAPEQLTLFLDLTPEQMTADRTVTSENSENEQSHAGASEVPGESDNAAVMPEQAGQALDSAQNEVTNGPTYATEESNAVVLLDASEVENEDGLAVTPEDDVQPLDEALGPADAPERSLEDTGPVLSSEMPNDEGDLTVSPEELVEQLNRAQDELTVAPAETAIESNEEFGGFAEVTADDRDPDEVTEPFNPMPSEVTDGSTIANETGDETFLAEGSEQPSDWDTPADASEETAPPLNPAETEIRTRAPAPKEGPYERALRLGIPFSYVASVMMKRAGTDGSTQRSDGRKWEDLSPEEIARLQKASQNKMTIPPVQRKSTDEPNWKNPSPGKSGQSQKSAEAKPTVRRSLMESTSKKVAELQKPAQTTVTAKRNWEDPTPEELERMKNPKKQKPTVLSVGPAKPALTPSELLGQDIEWPEYRED